MKLSKIILAASMLGAANLAAAAPPTALEREGALMLYVAKSFGGGRSMPSAPLAFGLRLDQIRGDYLAARTALFDARLSLSGRTTLAAAGVPMFDSGLEGQRWFASFESSGRFGGATGWLIAAVAVAGGACLAEFEICEDDKDPDRYTPGES